MPDIGTRAFRPGAFHDPHCGHRSPTLIRMALYPGFITGKRRTPAKPGGLARSPGILPASAGPEAGLLLVSRGLRAFGDGLVSLLLPVYLATLGPAAFQIAVHPPATPPAPSLSPLGVGLSP